MTRAAPRAGGGRAAFRFDRGGGGSRRRQAHEQGLAACKVMRWATLPCPLGKGRCGGAGATLFAPAGQKRYRVGAPDFGLSRGKDVCEAVCPSGDVWQARRGRRVAAACVPRSHRVSAAVPQGERRALPAPAQGINPLRIPFWGRQPFPPRPPSPKTPQAAGPCSWACRRLLPSPPQPNQNAATPPHS